MSDNASKSDPLNNPGSRLAFYYFNGSRFLMMRSRNQSYTPDEQAAIRGLAELLEQMGDEIESSGGDFDSRDSTDPYTKVFSNYFMIDRAREKRLQGDDLKGGDNEVMSCDDMDLKEEVRKFTEEGLTEFFRSLSLPPDLEAYILDIGKSIFRKDPR
jgi:hypothetical protein